MVKGTQLALAKGLKAGAQSKALAERQLRALDHVLLRAAVDEPTRGHAALDVLHSLLRHRAFLCILITTAKGWWAEHLGALATPHEVWVEWAAGIAIEPDLKL